MPSRFGVPTSPRSRATRAHSCLTASGGAAPGLGRLLGAARTGLSVYELPPGQAVSPYHYEES